MLLSGRSVLTGGLTRQPSPGTDPLKAIAGSETELYRLHDPVRPNVPAWWLLCTHLHVPGQLLITGIALRRARLHIHQPCRILEQGEGLHAGGKHQG